MLGAGVPNHLDDFAKAGLSQDLRRHAETQPFQGTVQGAKGGPAGRRVHLLHVPAEAQEGYDFCRKILYQRIIVRGGHAGEQPRQTLLAVQVAQAAGQVDPIPGLVELVAGDLAVELVFQYLARFLRTDFGQSANAKDVLRAVTETGGNTVDHPHLQPAAEAALRRLHFGLIELPSLVEVEVLAGHGR